MGEKGSHYFFIYADKKNASSGHELVIFLAIFFFYLEILQLENYNSKYRQLNNSQPVIKAWAC